MENILKQPVDWKVTETEHFVIKAFMSSAGLSYTEYTSKATVRGWPLVHVTLGRNPETGRRKVAKGVFALGRIAVGVLPVGQLAVGVFPLGQVAVGGLIAVGQASAGLVAVGQAALALLFAFGQLAAGYAAVGQFAIGYYTLGQMAAGAYEWTPRIKDPEAIAFFKSALGFLSPFRAASPR